MSPSKSRSPLIVSGNRPSLVKGSNSHVFPRLLMVELLQLMPLLSS